MTDLNAILMDIKALFDNEFAIQKEGQPRAFSEYMKAYEISCFIANLTSGTEMEVPLHNECLHKAIVAFAAEWIASQKRRTVGACAIIWRRKPELETFDGYPGYDGYRTKQLKLYFRAHVLTKEAFEAGPTRSEEPA